MILSKINQLPSDKAGNYCSSQNMNPDTPIPSLGKKVLMSTYNDPDTKNTYHSFFDLGPASMYNY